MAGMATFVELVDWLEDRLPPDEAEQIAAAVEADNALRQAVAWIQEFRCLADGIVLSSPPSALRPKLEALFAAYHAGEGGVDWWRCYDARLAIDRVERGERRLSYTSPVGGVTLVVKQRPRDARLDVHGAIVPDRGELAPFAVELQQDGRTVRLLASDQWGEFTFSRLDPGHYQLALSGDNAELAIPDLRLGPP